jgi:vacuolar-type H+-ATPase catalytic subunit A/Vma1
MIHFINKLPIDIVLKIISYTYNFQNKPLLNDIEDYTKSKTLLLELYHQFWVFEMSEYEEEKNWLINDIFAYANNYNATMYGYIDKFYNIFKRNKYLQTKVQIDKYVNKLEKEQAITQINIFLGLLTIQERNDIIIAFLKNMEL